MAIELHCLFWASLLLLVLVSVQGATVPVVQGFAWGLGPRDAPRERTRFQRRMDRVVANHIESLAIFAGLVTVGQLAGISTEGTQAGAALFLAARIAFAALYAAGVPYLRSLAWGAGTLGLLVLAAEILRAGLA